MPPLLALNHRKLILAALPPDGLMLEWGCGGSTGWFLANMTGGQRLISVEHDDSWMGQCKAVNREYGGPLWQPLLRPAVSDALVGANATPFEECPAGLALYIVPILPLALAQVDVFLVDGVARGACLATVAIHGKSGARVFCHDVHRGWYDWIIGPGTPRFADYDVIHADAGEYPPPLWTAKLGVGCRELAQVSGDRSQESVAIPR